MDPMEDLEDAQMNKDRTGGLCETLTVLDAFAGLAMEGLIAMRNKEFEDTYCADDGYVVNDAMSTIANIAYRHAAAMLRARAKI